MIRNDLETYSFGYFWFDGLAPYLVLKFSATENPTNLQDVNRGDKQRLKVFLAFWCHLQTDSQSITYKHQGYYRNHVRDIYGLNWVDCTS